MEDKADDRKERTAEWIEHSDTGFPEYALIDQAWIDQWMDGWNEVQADPLDDISLFMLYYQPELANPEEEEEEYVWDPQPDAWQIALGLNPDLVQNDVIDQYWDCYEEGELIHYEHRPLGCVFHPPTMDAFSNVINDYIYEDEPTFNFVFAELLCLVVPILEDCSITILESVLPLDPSKEKTGWPITFDQGSLDLLFKDFSQAGWKEMLRRLKY